TPPPTAASSRPNTATARPASPRRAPTGATTPPAPRPTRTPPTPTRHERSDHDRTRQRPPGQRLVGSAPDRPRGAHEALRRRTHLGRGVDARVRRPLHPVQARRTDPDRRAQPERPA